YILMVQRVNVPNSDASDVRRGFQEAANEVFSNLKSKKRVAGENRFPWLTVGYAHCFVLPRSWCDAASRVSQDGLGRCQRFPVVRSSARRAVGWRDQSSQACHGSEASRCCRIACSSER